MSIMSKEMNNDKTLRNIYDKYFKGLVVYSLSYTHRLNIAEDIVQDVIINFFVKNRQTDIKGSILPYLRGAVIKASIKYNRDNNKFIIEDIENTIIKNLCSYVEEEEDDTSVKNLMISIEKLPKRSKEIVKLIMYENKKMEQVADELSISINSVKSQYYSSLSRIKEMLTKTYLIFF